MTAGDIFWAKHGRIWYPAKVCTQNEIPEHVLQKLTIKHKGQNFCKMVGGGQLISDHYTKLINTKQRDPLKSTSLCLNWSHWHLVQILYTFMCKYHYITVPWLHFAHFVGMKLVQHFVWKGESLPLS